MPRERFYVCRATADGHGPIRWLVRKDDAPYGEYLSESSAILDAVEAAQDAGSCGSEVEVMVEDADGRTRLAWTTPESPLVAAPAPFA
jgi:hypothetical protein